MKGVFCAILHVPMWNDSWYTDKKAKGEIAMTKHYEQRKKANETYLAKLDEIRIRVPKGKKEEYKQMAEAAGKSLNQYIVDCIEKDSE